MGFGPAPCAQAYEQHRLRGLGARPIGAYGGSRQFCGLRDYRFGMLDRMPRGVRVAPRDSYNLVTSPRAP
jgi:hypothetical protein